MMSFAVLVLVKATLVCGVAFLLSRLCRRARASIRHLLFALAFIALVAVPVASTVLPTVTVTLPATATVRAPQGRDTAAAVQSSAGAEVSESGIASVSQDTAPARTVTITQVLTATWLIGLALFMAPVVVGFWQVRRLRQSALAWTDEQALVQTLAFARGVHRRIDAVLHDAVTGPMTFGVLRPSIILPESAREWDETSLRCALRHELEHVARLDFLTNCLSRMVCAVYWFHPLVWAAWRRLRLEAERACDDAVVREDDAGDYASLLVAMAQREPAKSRRPLLAMAGRDDLAARVTAVLDDSQTRGRIGRRRATGLIFTGGMAILGVASITVARAMPQTQATGAAAQAPAVTSFKRYPSSQIRQVDGRTVATSVTARELIRMAYGVRDVENAPWWVGTDRFDIILNAPLDAPGPKQESTMLQSLLAERFKLVAHRGSKEFPIYALVLARPDGRLGPQLTRSQLDCSREAVRARSARDSSPSPPEAGDRPTCAMSSTYGRLTGGGITMAQLASHLPVGTHVSRNVFDREVIDRTGLSGRFDFTLLWTPDRADPIPDVQSGPPQFRPFTSSLESYAPRLLAALQEQLGLKLDSQLAPKPVLVIDSIEPATEN